MAVRLSELEGQRRFTVNITGSAYEALEEIARRKGKTKAEVLLDAIGLLRWFEDTYKEGHHVLVQRGSQFREIIPH